MYDLSLVHGGRLEIDDLDCDDIGGMMSKGAASGERAWDQLAS